MKTTLAVLLLTATSVLCEDNHFKISFDSNANNRAVISIPRSFVLQTHLMMEEKSGGWRDTNTDVQWLFDVAQNRAKYAYVDTNTGNILTEWMADYSGKYELKFDGKHCTKKELAYDFNLGSFLSNVFDTTENNQMFEYVGEVMPAFDKFEKHYAFVTRDSHEEPKLPIEQRSTQFYFDAELGQSNWIKFYTPNHQSELHNILSVEEDEFEVGDFGLDNCSEHVATPFYDVYYTQATI